MEHGRIWDLGVIGCEVGKCVILGVGKLPAWMPVATPTWTASRSSTRLRWFCATIKYSAYSNTHFICEVPPACSATLHPRLQVLEGAAAYHSNALAHRLDHYYLLLGTILCRLNTSITLPP
jgi:hypothetical protein